MLKNIVCAFFFILQASILFAEAPELKIVMPNSWQRLVRLTDSEEKEFLETNKKIIDNNKKEANALAGNKYNNLFLPNNIQIYKDIFGKDIFYRVILCRETDPNYLSKNIQFLQLLIYNNTLLAVGVYNHRGQSQLNNIILSGFDAAYVSIDIVGTSGKAVGVLITCVLTRLDDKLNFDTILNNQLSAKNRSAYFPLDKFNRNIELTTSIGINSSYFCFPNEHIVIHSLNCLFDKDVPLKYSLQNAFDNNPVTSYVENEKDNLINIWFYSINILYATKEFAMINGYAQNNTLYYNNNRVKKILYTTKEPLSSGTFNYNRRPDDFDKFQRGLFPEKITYTRQIVADGGQVRFHVGPDQYETASSLLLVVTDIYKGNKYNDTCIAEINIKTENGWLFGDIEN